MLKNLKITAKLGIGFGVVLLLFAVAVFFSWRSISGVQNEMAFLSKVVQAVGMTSTMNDTVSWVRAGIRDLRYSESEDDISTLQGYINDLRPKVDALKRLYAEVPRIDILAQASNVETALRSSTANLDKVISMIRSKKAAVKTLDEGIAQMQELFNDLIETQTKRSYATAKDVALGNIEQGKIEEEINRKTDRLKVIQGAAASLTHAAWRYQEGMQYRDIKTLNEVVKELNDLQTVCENFASSTRDTEITKKLTNARGAFLTFKTSFAEVLKSYTETDPLFLALLKDGRQMVDVADKIMSTCLGHLNRLMGNASNNLGSSVLLLIALAVAAIIIGLIIATFLAGSIRKPLGRVVELVTNARDGDMSIIRDDFHYEGHDELGELGDALSEMFISLRTAITDIRDNANSSTEKASTMHEDAKANFDGANSVRKAVADAVKLMESNSASLEESNAGTQEMSAASMTSAQAATDCAEFISNVTQVANKATQTVQEAIANMAILQKKTDESGEKLQGLVDSVDKISEFIGVITSIADQTNLLALNAAIEAARAGEAGRGFAVVAESVRKLAEESGRAADSVRGLMGALQDGARNTKSASDETAELLVQTVEKANGAKDSLAEAMGQIDKANDRIQNIAAVAEEQAASSKEIATGIDNVTKATTEILEHLEGIKTSMDETAVVAERAAKISDEQTQLAQDLRDSLSMFNVGEGSDKAKAKGRKALPAKK